mmetsp:Transcript_794/g.2879  ORF Transcript_794/g.2879 Transcript_794/m.2879 type:complete len:293 (-) Transcript_794:116-994(-)
MTDAWDYWAYDVTHFVLCVEYVVLFAVSCWMLASLYNNTRLKRAWQLGFFCFINAGCAVRCVFNFAQPFIIEDIIHVENSVNFFFNNLPSFFFCSAYSILLYHWAHIVHLRNRAVRHDPTAPTTLKSRLLHSKLAIVFCAINVVVYLVVFILFAVDILSQDNDDTNVSNPENPVEDSISIIIASCYILGSIGFLVYGIQAYRTFKRYALVSTSQRSIIEWKLRLMVLLVPLCFTIRASIIIYGLFVTLSANWWFDFVYYNCLELFPLLMLLALLHAASNRQTEPIPDPTGGI